MPEGDLDTRVRSRASEFLREQTALHGEALAFATLTRGFQVEGQRVPLPLTVHSSGALLVFLARASFSLSSS